MVGVGYSNASPPVLAVNNQKLYLFYNDTSYYYLDKFDENGYANVESFVLGGFTLYSLASHNGNLYTVLVDDSIGYLKTCINSSSNCFIISGNFASTPSLATWNGDLYMGYIQDSNVKLAKLVNQNWQVLATITSPTTTFDPYITVFKNQLYLLWKVGFPSHSLYLSLWNGTSLVPLNGGNNVGGSNNSSYSLVGTEDKLYIAYTTSFPLSVQYRTYDGTSWSAPSANLREWVSATASNQVQVLVWEEIPLLLWHESSISNNYRIYMKALE